jgi:two-component system, OmpR family, sensor histidine kinase BaeS
MMGRSLRTRLLASFFVAIALPLAVLGMYAVPAIERATLDYLLTNLTLTARLTAAEVAAAPQGVPRSAQINRWARVLGVRVAVVLPGTAFKVSADLPQGITGEPGMPAALGGEVAKGQLKDAAGRQWLYAAVPVQRGGAVAGAVDLLLPLSNVEMVFWQVRWALAAAFAIAAALAAGVVLYLTDALFRPVAALKAAAQRVGAGDLEQRLPESADELGDLARVMNGMARALNERETHRRDFLANVSHELRTPAANIQFTAHALLAGAAAERGQRERMLETVAREADRLTRLVRQLLDLWILQSGHATLPRQRVPVRGLLEDAAGRFTARAAAAEVRLEVQAVPGAAAIEGDPDRLAEMLDNLLDNALRSTPAAGSVTLAARADDGAIVLEVADTGRGIRGSDLLFIFERFYRGGTARDRASGGSGLGLSIVKAIVDAHGGQISASSSAAGTKFLIRFPRPNPEGTKPVRLYDEAAREVSVR